MVCITVLTVKPPLAKVTVIGEQQTCLELQLTFSCYKVRRVYLLTGVALSSLAWVVL